MGRLGSVALAGVAAALLLLACESPAALGASCDRNAQCASPLVCRLARCRSECIENRDCPLGAECLIGSDGQRACSLPADRGCTSGGTACATPLACVDDDCVNTCSTTRDCPADGECRSVVGTALSFCFAPDRSQDAGTIEDAGDAGSACADGTCTRSICVGDRFACAIHTGSHTVGCWGSNAAGQLGDGTDRTTHATHGLDGGVDAGPDSVDFSATAVTVIDDAGDPIVASALACTEQAACAIIANGSIVCWGGEGGSGSVLSGDPAIPLPARAHLTTLGTGFSSVVGGRYHYCASRGGSGPGAVVCWGDTNHGALGDGIAPGGRIDTMLGDVWGGDSQLALGNAVTCALRQGQVSCSGGDDDGSQGSHATHFPADEPAPVGVPLSDVDAGVDLRATELVAGAGFECVLLESRSVACWGWGAQGSLGFPIAAGDPLDDCTSMGTTVPGASPPCRRTPTRVDLGTAPTVRLWSGGFTPIACAQNDAEQTSCWGELPSGNCGTEAGSTHCRAPVRVPVLDHAIEIAMGPLSTCGRMRDGSITCIGTNELGALGRGTNDPASMPRFDAIPVIGF